MEESKRGVGMARKGKSGWFGDHRRHVLAGKGVSTVLPDGRRLAVNNFVAGGKMPKCRYCGKVVIKSDNPEYVYQCMDCDEDFYSFELEGEWFQKGARGISISDMRERNERMGNYFFSPDTMRFFKSRILGGSLFKDKYFITSEKQDYDSPRLFTVRSFDYESGEVGSVSEFQEFERLVDAKRFMSKLD